MVFLYLPTFSTCLLPHVQKDELEVQAGSEHEHVSMEFDLSDTTGRQGVSNCYQAHSLIAWFIEHHVHHVLTHFQVATAVDDLGNNGRKQTSMHSKGAATFPNQTSLFNQVANYHLTNHNVQITVTEIPLWNAAFVFGWISCGSRAPFCRIWSGL